MYKKQTSSIAQKSQKWIANAFLRLLETQSFSEITVTQICQEAGLVRKTFYRNFDTKEDIFHYILDQLFESFQNNFDIQTVNSGELFRRYYEYWTKEKKLLTYLHRNNLFFLLIRKYIEYVESLHIYLIVSTNTAQTNLESYVIHFIAGGMVSILEHWLECGFEESIDNLTKLTQTLLLSTNSYLISSNPNA